MNLILHSTELHIGSFITYENALYGNYFLNCYIVKRILISFNCFSEYIMHERKNRHIILRYICMICIVDITEIKGRKKF